jgi:hypothetical protein
MSVTHENSAKCPLAVTQKDKALSAKFARARVGTFRPLLGRPGPDSIQFSSHILFFFFYKPKTILEIGRKMVKMPN